MREPSGRIGLVPVSIKDDFIRAYIGRALEIDCPKVTLRQGKDQAPRIFEGSGLIAQDEAGELQLRMYPKDMSFDVGFKMLFSDDATPPGVILPPEAFYSLEATDWRGHTWSCPRVRPQMSSGPGGAIIGAEIDSLLSSRSAASSSTHWLRLVFPERLKLAWNRSTQDTLRSGDRTLREKHERTRAEFTVDALSFEIQKDDREPASTTVTVRSPQVMPAGIEWRVQEALRFVMFRGVFWGIAEIATGNEHRIRIVPPIKMRRNMLPPPLETMDPHEDYWRLFGAYFKYACNHTNAEAFHPLSGQLNAILATQSPSIEILALLLGVAVEGVLKTEFTDLATPSAEFLAEVGKASDLIGKMDCDPRLRARIRGTLGQMRNASAKDKLHALRERGLVSEASSEAWAKLRNSAAHAAHLDPFALQEHVTRCHQVYELLLTLVYLAIGYEGAYRQYSAERWPRRDFPPRPSVER